jgi:hypothetical protein
LILLDKVVAEEQKQEVQLDLDLPSEVIPDTESCTVSAMGKKYHPHNIFFLLSYSGMIQIHA